MTENTRLRDALYLELNLPDETVAETKDVTFVKPVCTNGELVSLIKTFLLNINDRDEMDTKTFQEICHLLNKLGSISVLNNKVTNDVVAQSTPDISSKNSKLVIQ